MFGDFSATGGDTSQILLSALNVNYDTFNLASTGAIQTVNGLGVAAVAALALVLQW